MRVLFIGDLVGRPGRRAAGLFLKEERQNYDFVIANAENAAGGFGITKKIIEELENLKIDFFTSGNHIWNKKDGVELLDKKDNLLRPLNYPPPCPGAGWRVVNLKGLKFLIMNMMGQVFIQALESPFKIGMETLKVVDYDIALIDFHAEATAEKIALYHYLKDYVTVFIGTHTHVQTADEKITDGKAYITDAGMCGSAVSVIGVKIQKAVERFLTQRPNNFEISPEMPLIFNAVDIVIDETTKKVVQFSRINKEYEGGRP